MKESKNKDFCGIVMLPEKNKAMQFNQYMKSDNVSWIIYADLENLIKKNMDVQTTSKNLQQQKQVIILLADIQVQLYGYGLWFLIIRKQAYIITWKKLYEKVLYFFKRTCYKCN